MADNAACLLLMPADHGHDGIREQHQPRLLVDVRKALRKVLERGELDLNGVIEPRLLTRVHMARTPASERMRSVSESMTLGIAFARKQIDAAKSTANDTRARLVALRQALDEKKACLGETRRLLERSDELRGIGLSKDSDFFCASKRLEHAVALGEM